MRVVCYFVLWGFAFLLYERACYERRRPFLRNDRAHPGNFTSPNGTARSVPRKNVPAQNWQNAQKRRKMAAGKENA